MHSAVCLAVSRSCWAWPIAALMLKAARPWDWLDSQRLPMQAMDVAAGTMLSLEASVLPESPRALQMGTISVEKVYL